MTRKKHIPEPAPAPREPLDILKPIRFSEAELEVVAVLQARLGTKDFSKTIKAVLALIAAANGLEWPTK